MGNKTSIAISREHRNILASLGTKDSTFDDIIQELIKKFFRKYNYNNYLHHHTTSSFRSWNISNIFCKLIGEN